MNQKNVLHPLRLRTISVTRLFGVFDHRIELNDGQITIIHGANGFGKTAILRLVAGFFERRYSMLRNVPFEAVEFELDGGISISVTQPNTRANGKTVKPDLFVQSGEHSWKWQNVMQPRSELPRHFFDERIPWLQRIDDDVWFDNQSGEQLDASEVVDRYAEYLPIKHKPDKTPDWLKDIQNSVNVYFIRANRLETPTAHDQFVRLGRPRPFLSAPAVANYANELSQRIQRVQAEYANLAQSLDRSFPLRIMSQNGRESLSLEDVKLRLKALDQQRKDLNSVGLLEQTSQEVEHIPEPEESQRGVLTVYINDVTQKLDVFRDLRKRIELFRELLNNRFLYKQVRIDNRQGLVFQTDSGQELPPTSLSTGEQHEVVILYQLLFLTQPDSLVLIDEPEISLHVAWQKPFLKDIARIALVSKVDFLIATHSPQIIGNRWDLTVELKGPRG